MTTTQFNKLMTVQVKSSRRYKRYDLNGKYGTVMSVYSENIGVLVDDEHNDRSGLGYFYFTPEELEVVDNDHNKELKENNNMQNVTGYYNIAKIRYLDNTATSVHNYANFDTSLEVGDLCVVKSLNHGLGLARVVEIIVTTDIQTPREIVAKVWTDDYDERVKVRKKAAELKAKMEARAKQLQDVALYQMLAQNDPDMMALLEEYQGLSK